MFITLNIRNVLIFLALASVLGIFVVPQVALSAGPPEITAVSPSYGVQDTTVNIAIGGKNFDDPTVSAVSILGGELTVTFTIVNNNRIDAVVVINEIAEPTARDVVVTNSAGQGTLVNGFTVLTSAEIPETPDQCEMKRDVGVPGCPSSGTVGPPGSGADIETEIWGMCCLLNTIYSVTTWIFYILLLFVVVMGIVGGFFYITAAGDPDKASKGKSLLIFAIIGLVIALIARFIPSIIRAVMGV